MRNCSFSLAYGRKKFKTKISASSTAGALKLNYDIRRRVILGKTIKTYTKTGFALYGLVRLYKLQTPNPNAQFSLTSPNRA